MTLLNFDAYIRPAKIRKARDIFLKGQVTELSEQSGSWEAKMKIGSYYVECETDALEISSTSCTCDDHSSSGCPHIMVVLFAIRKEFKRQ